MAAHPRRRARPPRPTGPAGARGPITWQVDLFPVAITLGDDPSARPALLLVMEPGRIVRGDIVAHPPADARGVATELATAIRAAAETERGFPDAIDVRNAAVADALRKLLDDQAGLTVRAVKSLPDVDDAAASYDQHVIGRPADAGQRPRLGHPDTWAGWTLPKEQIARLFAAAARYYRAAPWKGVVNDDVFRLTIPGGDTWSASVMGNAAELYGIALYSDHLDLLGVLAGGSPEGAFGEMEGAVLSLSFGAKDDLSPRMRKEVTWARWEVAGPSAYPDLIAINTLGGGVTEHQMEALIRALETVPRFVRAHAALLSGDPDEPLILTWTDEESGVGVGFVRAIA